MTPRAWTLAILGMVLCTVVLLWPAPGPDQSWEQARRPMGYVIGQVFDASTNEPLPGVIVALDEYPMAMVDSAGWFEISWEYPGHYMIWVEASGYYSEAKGTYLQHDRPDTVNFRLRPAAAPCCHLAGTWSIELRLDRRAELGPAPTAHEITGTVTFHDSLTIPGHRRVRGHGTRNEVGRHAVDFTPFFGGPVAEDVSWTMFGPSTKDFLNEVSALVFAADSVTMVFVPRLSHGGITLKGRLVGDTIDGTWTQNAYCCGANGTFRLTRTRNVH